MLSLCCSRCTCHYDSKILNLHPGNICGDESGIGGTQDEPCKGILGMCLCNQRVPLAVLADCILTNLGIPEDTLECGDMDNLATTIEDSFAKLSKEDADLLTKQLQEVWVARRNK